VNGAVREAIGSAKVAGQDIKRSAEDSR